MASQPGPGASYLEDLGDQAGLTGASEASGSGGDALGAVDREVCGPLDLRCLVREDLEVLAVGAGDVTNAETKPGGDAQRPQGRALLSGGKT